jgi:hypothetical protein
MINLTIGWNADDFLLGKLSFRVEVQGKSGRRYAIIQRFNQSLLENNPLLFCRYIKYKCRHWVINEKFISITFAGPKPNIPLIILL